jgi:hypothetical protein
MNDDTPPPLASNPNPAPAPQAYQRSGESGGKVLAGCGIGCLVLVTIAVVAVIVGVNFGKKKIQDFAQSYTSDAPVEIVAPEFSETQIEDSVGRYDGFRSAISAGNATEALILSEDDINAILFHHPNFREIAGNSIVSIEDDRLTTTVSIDLDGFDIPIEFIAEAVEGKYFNGDVTLSIEMIANRPALHIEKLSVAGKSLPEQVMQEFRKENLLQNAQTDPEMQKIFDKVEEVKIENNRLVIIPRSSP